MQRVGRVKRPARPARTGTFLSQRSSIPVRRRPEAPSPGTRVFFCGPAERSRWTHACFSFSNLSLFLNGLWGRALLLCLRVSAVPLRLLLLLMNVVHDRLREEFLLLRFQHGAQLHLVDLHVKRGGGGHWRGALAARAALKPQTRFIFQFWGVVAQTYRSVQPRSLRGCWWLAAGVPSGSRGGLGSAPSSDRPWSEAGVSACSSGPRGPPAGLSPCPCYGRGDRTVNIKATSVSLATRWLKCAQICMYGRPL